VSISWPVSVSNLTLSATRPNIYNELSAAPGPLYTLEPGWRMQSFTRGCAQWRRTLGPWWWNLFLYSEITLARRWAIRPRRLFVHTGTGLACQQRSSSISCCVHPLVDGYGGGVGQAASFSLKTTQKERPPFKHCVAPTVVLHP
jgi:hypothetical protein